MKENCRKIFAALLTLALAVTLCACAGSAPESAGPSGQDGLAGSNAPVPEPEPEPEPETPVELIMESYYQEQPPEVKNDNGFELPGPEVGRVAPWYNTETGDRETLEALLEKLKNGERLSDNLTPETSVSAGPAMYETWGEALVYGEDGEVCGHVRVSLVTGQILGVWDYREPNEDFFPDYYRNDFRWPQLLETAIAEGKIDPDTAKLTACNFASFATGAVLYDDQREYFIPTNRTALHQVDFEVGKLYPVPELAEMLQENIDVLFGYPPMTTGALNTSADPEPEGRPEIWTGTLEDMPPEEQMMHWSEEEIWRLMTEIAAQLYQKDEALTGLTPVFRQGEETDVAYSYGIHVKGVPTGYYAYQNDAGEDVAFRAVTCSVTWVESERKYVLDLISFEEWEKE